MDVSMGRAHDHDPDHGHDAAAGPTAYDAVSQCSRCGYCEQVCPTYVASGQEGMSPRGRNQLFRLMLEGKLKDPASAAKAFDSCLLCGACSTACYASVPTAEFVLEGRRSLRGGRAPLLVRLFTSLREDSPGLLAFLMGAVNLLRRTGLARLACLLRLPSLAGLGALEAAERKVRAAPLRTLRGRLAGREDLEGQDWTYFPACGTNYLFPEVGEATLACAQAGLGSGRLSSDRCCGLLAYNYGELEAARRQARAVIEDAEGQGAGPVIVDCSSCAAHLKSYEALFKDEPEFRPRAAAYAARVKDVSEAFAAPEPKRTHLPKDLKVTWHDACRSKHGQKISAQPRELLKAWLGRHYVELPEADWCCGGAGTFAFVQSELSDAALRRKVDKIASIQADVVVASSTSCLLQLDAGLRKYYPQARVEHLSSFLAQRLKEPTDPSHHGPRQS